MTEGFFSDPPDDKRRQDVHDHEEHRDGTVAGCPACAAEPAGEGHRPQQRGLTVICGVLSGSRACALEPGHDEPHSHVIPQAEYGQQTGLTQAAALSRLLDLGVSNMAAGRAIEMAPSASDGVIVDGNLVSYADNYGWAVTPPNSPESGGLPWTEPPDPELSGLTWGQATVALRRLGYPGAKMILVQARAYGQHLTDRHLVSFHGGDDEDGFDILPRRHPDQAGESAIVATDGDLSEERTFSFTDYEARWLSQVRDITADPLVTDAQAGGRIRALLFPAHMHDDDGTVEGCPGCFPPGEAIPRSGPGWDYGPDWPAGHDQAPDPTLALWPWPELGEGWNIAEILAAIRVIDAHLDANATQAYRDQPLAQDWARITKVCEEAGEVWKAHSRLTGENPRMRHAPATREDVLDELGDTASAALCGIQHITKDTDVTWAVFIAALAKGLSRIPQARPASTTTEGDTSS